MRRTSLNLPDNLMEWVIEQAKKDNRSLSGYIAHVLIEEWKKSKDGLCLPAQE